MESGAQKRMSARPTWQPKSTRKPKNYARKYWWVAAIIVPIVVAVIGLIPETRSNAGGLPGITLDSHDLNLTSIPVIEGEYKAKTGQELPPDVRQRLQQAQTLIEQRRFDEGLPMLRQTAESLQLASLFGELGTALALAGKKGEAEAAFLKASSTDPNNRAAIAGRRFFDEATSNNTILKAAKISLGEGVSSKVFDGDSDFFQFISPEGPRDYMRLQLTNESTTLHPQVTIFDGQKSRLNGISKSDAADIELLFGVMPSQTTYVQVSPFYSGGGTYSLKIEPAKAFDELEPNDMITEAKSIPTGKAVELNLLDERDVDYFSFQAQSSKVVISLQNRSTTLHPLLALFDAQKSKLDQRQSSDAADLQYELNASAGATYYIQISPFYSTGGKYALTIQ